MRILLARHGETNANIEGIIQGPVVDQPLNERGRSQADALARYLARNETPDAIYSSPLLRAHETAHAVARSTGLEVATLPGFHEVSWGEYNAKLKTEAITTHLESVLTAWSRGDLTARTPGGESPHEVWARAEAELKPLFDRHENQTILLVGHGRINKIVLSGLVHRNLHHMEDFAQPNAGLTRLKRGEREWICVDRGTVTHLEGIIALDERAG